MGEEEGFLFGDGRKALAAPRQAGFAGSAGIEEAPEGPFPLGLVVEVGERLIDAKFLAQLLEERIINLKAFTRIVASDSLYFKTSVQNEKSEVAS